MSNEPVKFDTWALVEVMGHTRYAGRVSEASIGGAAFIRVDVPDCGEGKPGFTKYLGGGSIFAITPCGEAEARATAVTWREMPYIPLIAPQNRLSAPTPSGEWDDALGSDDENFEDDT